MTMRTVPNRVTVLGVPVAALRLEELLAQVVETIDGRTNGPLRIGYANAHVCNLAWNDAGFREALRCMDIVYADGNGPRVAAWFQGRALPGRMTGADWIHDLCEISIGRGCRMYFLGGEHGVAELAARRLTAAHPGLQVCGTQHGYLSQEHLSAIHETIRTLRPEILIVGMGSPRQEQWIVAHAGELGVPVVWGAGGMFDYASGVARRPPKWMRDLALEWLGRMLLNPRRLAGRYLIGVPLFIARAIADGLSRRISGRSLLD